MLDMQRIRFDIRISYTVSLQTFNFCWIVGRGCIAKLGIYKKYSYKEQFLTMCLVLFFIVFDYFPYLLFCIVLFQYCRLLFSTAFYCLLQFFGLVLYGFAVLYGSVCFVRICSLVLCLGFVCFCMAFKLGSHGTGKCNTYQICRRSGLASPPQALNCCWIVNGAALPNQAQIKKIVIRKSLHRVVFYCFLYLS